MHDVIYKYSFEVIEEVSGINSSSFIDLKNYLEDSELTSEFEIRWAITDFIINECESRNETKYLINEDSISIDIKNLSELVSYFTYLLPEEKFEKCCDKYNNTYNFCPECGSKIKL